MIRHCQSECDVCIVVLRVAPSSGEGAGNGVDEETTIQRCVALHVGAVFAPARHATHEPSLTAVLFQGLLSQPIPFPREEIFPRGFATELSVQTCGGEGLQLTLWTVLLHIVRPHRIYFGQAQVTLRPTFRSPSAPLDQIRTPGI
jgi:hypothetical protein